MLDFSKEPTIKAGGISAALPAEMLCQVIITEALHLSLLVKQKAVTSHSPQLLLYLNFNF